MQNGTLVLARGDNQNVGLSVLNPDGSPYNLSGCLITFTAKETSYFSCTLLTKTVTGSTGHLDEANGQSQLVFIPSDTQSLDSNTKYFDVKLTSQSGLISTLIYGDLKIVPF